MSEGEAQRELSKAQVDALHETNDRLQDFVARHEGEVPDELVVLLTDLDWILNGP